MKSILLLTAGLIFLRCGEATKSYEYTEEYETLLDQQDSFRNIFLDKQQAFEAKQLHDPSEADTIKFQKQYFEFLLRRDNLVRKMKKVKKYITEESK